MTEIKEEHEEKMKQQDVDKKKLSEDDKKKLEVLVKDDGEDNEERANPKKVWNWLYYSQINYNNFN